MKFNIYIYIIECILVRTYIQQARM